VTGGEDGTCKVWNTATGREIETLRSFWGQRAAVGSVAFSSGDKLLAIGYSNGDAVVYDAAAMTVQRRFQAHNAPVGSMAFSPDGKYLATASFYRNLPWEGRTAKVWDIKTGGVVLDLAVRTTSVVSVAFSPDGKYLVTGRLSRPVGVWEVETGRELPSLKIDNVSGLSLAFSASGGRLAIGGFSDVELWDVRTATRLLTIHRQRGALCHSVAFTPDGARLLAAGPGHNFPALWDAETGRELLSLKGHERGIWSVAVSPKGRYVATASDDRTAILWPAFPWNEDDYPGDANMPLERRIELYKHEYWETQLAAAESGVSSAKRIVNATTYSPSVPVHVDLELLWNANKSSVTVVENVPAGWTVEPITEAKGLETRLQGNKITWEIEPWTSPGATLEYTAIPPTSAGHALVAFADAFFSPDSGYPRRIENTSLAPQGALVFQQGVFPDPGYAGCRVTQILDSQADILSRGEEIEMGESFRPDNEALPLIQFDLSSVPSTYPLARAELRVFVVGEARLGRRISYLLCAPRLLRPWSEVRTKWEKTGMAGIRADVADPESSTRAGLSWPEWVTLDVTKSVQYFLDNPDKNYGWVLWPVRDPTVDYVSEPNTGLFAFGFRNPNTPDVHLRPMLILVPSEAMRDDRKTMNGHGGL
jgi:WD40 repeat protein